MRAVNLICSLILFLTLAACGGGGGGGGGGGTSPAPSGSGGGSTPPDTTAPTAPASVAAGTSTATAVSLNWVAATDATGVASYQIFRDGVLVGTSTTATFTDTTLSANTTYHYAVLAKDAAGNISPPSDPITVTTAPDGTTDTTPPTAPTALVVGSSSATSASFSWAAATDATGVASYEILRDGQTVGSSTSTSFTDTGLASSTTYHYAVQAKDAAGNVSPVSATLTVTTPSAVVADTTAPTVPSALVLGTSSTNALSLSWTASTDATGVTGYDILREGVLVGSSTTNSYTDTGLAASTTYHYTVRAKDAAGNVSASSTALTATTAAAPVVVTTANDVVPTYNGDFAYGSNTWYAGWSNNDKQVASLILGDNTAVPPQAGTGVHSLRTALFDAFIQINGINVRVGEFQYYKDHGAKDMTVFINMAYQIDKGCKTGAHFNWDSATSKTRCQLDGLTTFDDSYQYSRRDTKKYGSCTNQSFMHANMYVPIWITVSGVKKVNPDNYLAQYVSDIVTKYKDYGVKFYEVWNEPDFTSNYAAASDPANANYWGKKNPAPCDIYNTNAPISHHVRLHRVVYEVIKSIDPAAFVTTGGIGYRGYLEALLNNTDNPSTSFEQNAGEGDGTVEGATSTRYPLKGGAYFDALSFHSYPQYALNKYNGSSATGTCPTGQTLRADPNAVNSYRCYFEHSDAAVAQFIGLRDTLVGIMTAKGYDGNTYPKKEVIMTETNVPRVPAAYVNTAKTGLKPAENWGSDPFAANYIFKALVQAQISGIRQFYVYAPSDEVRADGTDCAGKWVGTDNTKVQGLFEKLSCLTGASDPALKRTVQATAYKTAGDLLYGWKYDATRTTALALPSNVGGGAFKNAVSGKYRYVLWAKTTNDRNETPTSISYTIPTAIAPPSGTVTRYEWDYSSTKTSSSVSSTAMSLIGAPRVFEP